MQVVPFVTETRDVRVIESNIGRVMPIVDIAKALDYDYNSLKGVLKRNSELFEGTMVGVTLTNEINQTSKYGEEYTRTRDFEVKALNSYGVFGLLMKLDYNRVQSEEKKQNVIRFQKWAMQVLGDVASGKKATVRKLTRTNRKTYNNVIDTLPEMPEGLNTYNKREAAEKLGVSERTIYRNVIKGLIPAYKRLNIHGHWEYAFKIDAIQMIVERNRKQKRQSSIREYGISKSVIIDNNQEFRNLKSDKE